LFLFVLGDKAIMRRHKGKTHHNPRHALKQHRIKIRLAVLVIIAIVVMVIEGIDRHRAVHLLGELTLVAPLDKMLDFMVFGGE
jgi:uncharacterized membrane protein YobD (UPF0266 family)